MNLPSSVFIQATTLDEALKARARRPEARFVAGGTTTIPDQNLGRFQPEGYISLRRIPGLRRIEETGDGLFLGAGCTMADLLTNALLEDQPMIRLAARTTGTRQLRSRSTVGGNLFTTRTDRTLPPCLLALEAVAHLVSASGESRRDLGETLRVHRERGAEPEILVGVTVPRAAGFQDFTRVAPRNGAGNATASVALCVDPGRKAVRLGLGGAGPVAMRALEAERFAESAIDWEDRSLDETAAVEFGEIAAAHCDPPDDAIGSAAYRRHAIKVMARRILERAWVEMP